MGGVNLIIKKYNVYFNSFCSVRNKVSSCGSCYQSLYSETTVEWVGGEELMENYRAMVQLHRKILLCCL